MAKKLRKMLGDVNAPSTVALMRLIGTQSKATICAWCIGYAESRLLPIFEKHCPGSEFLLRKKPPLNRAVKHRTIQNAASAHFTRFLTNVRRAR